MKLLKKELLEVKKSKFIAYFYEIENKEEVQEIFQQLKKEHKKAKHVPYAYFFQNQAGKSDDKEPSGTSGMPIYRTLELSEFRSHAIFVVRYFGGIKLGAGGLIRSYGQVSKNTILNYKKENNL